MHLLIILLLVAVLFLSISYEILQQMKKYLDVQVQLTETTMITKHLLISFINLICTILLQVQ